jgi:hypothetical protein
LSGRDGKFAYIKKKNWQEAVKHCFKKDPVICPECGTAMKSDVVFSFQAQQAIEALVKTSLTKVSLFMKKQFGMRIGKCLNIHQWVSA